MLVLLMAIGEKWKVSEIKSPTLLSQNYNGLLTGAFSKPPRCEEYRHTRTPLNKEIKREGRERRKKVWREEK